MQRLSCYEFKLQSSCFPFEIQTQLGFDSLKILFSSLRALYRSLIRHIDISLKRCWFLFVTAFVYAPRALN